MNYRRLPLEEGGEGGVDAEAQGTAHIALYGTAERECATLSEIFVGARTETPNLGRPIAPADMREWDIDIEPDPADLPAGSGSSEQGATIFAEKCALCHGDGGKGGVFLSKGAPAAPAVVEDKKINGIDETTTTIANYWPYATTLFDYIAMPWTEPCSLDAEVYAVTAYILAQNKLIDAALIIDPQSRG